MMQQAEDAPPVAVVGAGAVGSTLARRLTDCGYRVQAVLSRTADTAEALGERIGASVSGSMEAGLPREVRLVLICVPDEAISTVADILAGIDHPWPETIVGHTSGAEPAAALAPLSEKGVATMSFHPLQTFAPGTSPDALDGIVVGIEGDERAVTAGETIAHALGARPIHLTAGEKAGYHCAAALASNGLVALMAVVEEVFGAIDEASGTSVSANSLVGPIVEQTWDNLAEGSPEGVLTGPVARGDEATVRSHLEALAESASHLVPLYVALSTEMVRVAVRGGQLDAEEAESLLGMLQTSIDDSGEEPGSSASVH